MLCHLATCCRAPFNDSYTELADPFEAKSGSTAPGNTVTFHPFHDFVPVFPHESIITHTTTTTTAAADLHLATVVIH